MSAQSMSRKGNCLDNAMMENFFNNVKPSNFWGSHHQRPMARATIEKSEWIKNQTKIPMTSSRVFSLFFTKVVFDLPLNKSLKCIGQFASHPFFLNFVVCQGKRPQHSLLPMHAKCMGIDMIIRRSIIRVQPLRSALSAETMVISCRSQILI